MFAKDKKGSQVQKAEQGGTRQVNTEAQAVKCRWCDLRVASPCEWWHQTVISLCPWTYTRPQHIHAVTMSSKDNVTIKVVPLWQMKKKV